jgi:DNA-binding transcriptional LysR family regulator
MQRTPTSERLQWDDVRLFLALCRARTVGSAAQTLGVDASTVSRRLLALEEVVEATLFDRGRHGITATEAAERLLPIAEEMEQVMTRFTTTTGGLERDVSGLVRITCPSDVADVVIVPVLDELLARHPALRIALDPGEQVRDLTRLEADLALRTMMPTRGDLVVTRIATAPWRLVAAPRLARRLGTLRAWSDASWIGWSERLSHVGPARWLAKHLKGVEPRVRSDSLHTQLAALALGIGVALVPAPSIEHYGLVPVKIAAALKKDAAAWPTDELFLVTHRALREAPRVRAVWNLLVERFRDRAQGSGAERATRLSNRERRTGSAAELVRPLQPRPPSQAR